MGAGSHYLSTGFMGRHAGAGVLNRAIEILHLHARAWTAAHHYERRDYPTRISWSAVSVGPTCRGLHSRP